MITAFHTHADPLLPYGGRRHAHPHLFSVAVSVVGLTVGYPGSEPIVRDVSFEVSEGTLVALVGPNGAGKSTLLKAIAALLKPSTGTVSVFGVPPGGCHHRTAYLPQRGDIDWRFPVTTERLVLSGRYVHLGWLAWPKRQDYAIVQRTLDRLGIAHLAKRQIAELSGGQQQRVLIARALVQGADLFLFDEPFNNLDVETKTDLLGLITELRDSGKTLLVATHDFDRADHVFNSVIGLRNGRQESSLVLA
jgi:ABC-type Mn2+/Zn2+ transport system ATPase subunit